MTDQIRAAQPAPPTQGEVAELIRLLRIDAHFESSGGMPKAAARLTRAAELLSQRHPASVPVSERLPGPEDCVRRYEDDWCWGQERSLLTGEAAFRWRLMRVSALVDEAASWLPAHALPLPAEEGS
jgi:hypothetical protein